MDNFNVSIESASFNFRNEDAEINFQNRWDGSLPHYGLFNKTMNFLSSLGFDVGKDPRIEKDYKVLSKDHRYGIKGRLEFKANRYPAGFVIQFFQNAVFENKSGGEYDFDKYKKMPYLIKKQFLLTCNKLRKFFADLGIEDYSVKKPKTAEEKIKRDFVESCHHDQKDMDFNLSDYDGQTSTMPPGNHDYKFYDRDKNLLRNGEVKYFRDRNGYLYRGKIYHRLNMMFWIILDNKKATIRADHELFDPTESEPRHRVARKNTPKEHIEKITFIGSLTEKELMREIRRRKTALTNNIKILSNNDKSVTTCNHPCN